MSSSCFSSFRSKRGMALVIVLAVLVLVLGIAVAFISRAMTERINSNAYSNSVTTRLLADNVVNLVQAQVNFATTEMGSSQPLAWASQPGLVRTFRSDGSLQSAYKLYSDTEMSSSILSPATMQSALASWRTDTAHFCDLNAPVNADLDGDGQASAAEVVYPIVNPAGIPSAGGNSPYIDGFSITNAPGATARQPAPMPVRWLYVLRDGTMTAATGNGATATVETASKDNPIVGRVAFWTDDESCKLNINTAAYGTYWDVPRTTTTEDGKLARLQPTLREYQRYPGHPATTSLAPVFGYLFGALPNTENPFDALTGANESRFADFIYHITPRIESGGSRLATVVATNPVTLDQIRLYSSLEEILFEPSRTPLTQGGKTLTKTDLERMKFFLTAHSRAPELNLFHRPRISMWPINDGTNEKQPSSMDRLLAFCSTFNQIPFHLRRSKPDDPAADLATASNASLLGYLRTFMDKPFPGFGSATFNSKYTQDETNQISIEMLDYIRGTNIMSVSNYGATTFATDVTGNNFGDSQVLGTRAGQISPIIAEAGKYKGFGRIPTISRAVLQFFISDAVQLKKGVNPGDPDVEESLVTKGPMLTNKSAVNNAFTPRLTNAPAVRLPVNEADPPVPEKDLPYTFYTQAVLYFDFFDPMLGYPATKYNFDLLVDFEDGWTVTNADGVVSDLEWTGRNNIRIPVRYDGFHSYDYNRVGGGNTRFSNAGSGSTVLGSGSTVLNLLCCFPDVSRVYQDNLDNSTGNNGGDGLNDFYPLISAPVKIHPTFKTIEVTEADGKSIQFAKPPVIATTGAGAQQDGDTGFRNVFRFNGGRVKVRLVARHKDGPAEKDEVIQNFSFDFPAFTKPVPAHAHYTKNVDNTNPKMNTQRRQMNVDMNFRNRLTGTPARGMLVGGEGPGDTSPSHDKSQTYLIPYWDIAVSLEPAYGDARLIAAKYNLTTDPASLAAGTRASGDFVPHEDYFRNADHKEIRTRNAFSMRISSDNASRYYYGIYKGASGYPIFGKLVGNVTYGPNAQPNVPSRYINGVPTFQPSGNSANFPPDFDTGVSHVQDGAYVNRADEGSMLSGNDTQWPWFQLGGYTEDVVVKPTFYSPNKQMPGAGMLGSLPTGVKRDLPWQTLLFHPDPGADHPGSENPPDHLMLDLFWMPVVEPYAISEPLSTAGKVNLNHQILPFSYINRSTALRGILQTERIPAISNSDLSSGANDSYKGTLTNQAPNLKTRYPISLPETMKAIDARFAEGDVYRSETELCTLPLIPQGEVYGQNFAYNSSWWKSRTATGDNLRERPYTNMLPRLTTKSNIFTAYYKVQTLAKRPGSNPKTWEEGKDFVTGEYRGSSTIERFISPNLFDSAWSSAETTPNLDSYYRWRTLNQKQFSP